MLKRNNHIPHAASSAAHHLQNNKNSISNSISTPPSPSSGKLIRYILPQAALPSATDSETWEGAIIPTAEKLNWSEPAELRAHGHLLTDAQEKRLSVLNRRKDYQYPSLYKDHEERQAAIIAMSDTRYADTVCFCRSKNRVNRPGLCGKVKLCPYCAKLEAKDNLLKYLPRSSEYEFAFLTISFRGTLPYYNGTDVYDWHRYWDAGMKAVKRLVKAGHALGAFCREELAVEFSATHVNPHLHAILHVQGPDHAEMKRLLTTWVKTYTDDKAMGVDLEPSVKIRSINEESDFVRTFEYLLKPIDLVTPYKRAWDCFDSLEREGAPMLARDIRDFVEGFQHSIGDRIQVCQIGSFRHSPTAKFIGVPVKKRKKYKEYVANAIKSASQWSRDPGDDEDSDHVVTI